MSRLVLLGASGYVGQAFARELAARSLAFEAPSRARTDYTRFEVLTELLRRVKPDFLINAAGYTGKPNVDACEINRADTLQGNTIFPAMVAHACAVLGVPFGHVSSGCIYDGAKISGRVEKDLTTPECQALFRQNPGAIRRLCGKRRAELHFSPAPMQLLQRDQGAGGGEPRSGGPTLYLAVAHPL